MKFSSVALLSLAALASKVAASDGPAFSVDVYEGPKECSDDEKAVKGKFIHMHYDGFIHEESAAGEKGKKFDSSIPDRPFDFPVGVGEVIPGFDQALEGKCKGAKIMITIPPEMGYGDQGAGPDIPPGATLRFDTHIIEIDDKPLPPPNFFKEIDADKDGKLTKEEIEAFFQEKQGVGIPDGLWEAEDKDGDGFVTWEEFGGEKGDAPPGEEL